MGEENECKCELLQYHFITSATGEGRVLHTEGSGQSCHANCKADRCGYKLANFLTVSLSISVNGLAEESMIMLACKSGGDDIGGARQSGEKAHIYPGNAAGGRTLPAVAAYCRVSSDSDDQLNSFAAQQSHYYDFIHSHDHWELADIYADEGITGTAAAKRDDFQRMLSDCRKGRIDKILVKSVSRFARNTTDCLEALRELKALGISVYFEEQNIDTKMASSEMMTAVIASCAQAESESISQNMRWGVQKRMREGTYISSSVPYGYRLQGKMLVVDEREAAVVKRIYTAYLKGSTPLEIAQMLVQEGNTDREWRESTIRYILRNERYIGDAILQKTYTIEVLPYRRKTNRGECDKYYVEGYNPAVIEKDIFEAVQRLIQERYKLRGSKPGEHPLAGNVVCGICGSPCMLRNNKGKAYVSCRTHGQNTQLCGIKPVRVDSIYHAFLRLHYNLMHTPEILAYYLKQLHAIRKGQMLWGMDIVGLNTRISEILNQTHTLTMLNKQGLVDPDMYITTSNQLAEQLRKAKQQRERLLDREKNTIIEQTQTIMDVLRDYPDVVDEFNEELFCELIDKIIVESNTKIRFRLKNGLELPEAIERTVR